MKPSFLGGILAAIFSGLAATGGRATVYGDGTQTRDYVYVGDVVRAFLAAADADRPGIWNIGTGTETSVQPSRAAYGRERVVRIVGTSTSPPGVRNGCGRVCPFSNGFVQDARR